MEFEQLLELVKAVSESNVSSFTYEKDGEKISLDCGQTPQIMVAPAPQEMTVVPQIMPQQVMPQAAPAAVQEEKTEGKFIVSPLVGVFYAAPAEGADPFVKVGDQVKAGQVVAIVEAMKLMNEIEADVEGTIAEILVENGKAVEYGQPLFRVV